MENIEYLLTKEEMLDCDKNTVCDFKIPEIILMEQAALAAVRRIGMLKSVKGKRVLIFSGTGNNGGDGMAVARLLSQQGAFVTVFIVSNRPFEEITFSSSAFVQFEILEKMKIPIVTKFPQDTYDIMIDGILGVGLNKDITGYVSQVLEEANKRESYKIALDIPTGIHATTGKLMNIGFMADVTITFAFYKRGLFLKEGREYCGKVFLEKIGITEESFLGSTPSMFMLKGEVRDYLPPRNPDGHKGTFGKVLVIAGSRQVGGAALLAAKAAMKAGAGMVRILTHKDQYLPIFQRLPEALYDCYEHCEDIPDLVERAVKWSDCIVLGPGTGLDKNADILWQSVIEGEKKPLIMDADSLTLLSREKNTARLRMLQNSKETFRKLIFTPHPKEFSRMCMVCDLQREDIGEEYAKKMNAVLVRKDARSIIYNYNGRMALNLSGNHGMATAGSGDVLCGIIAAFMVNMEDSFEAAVTGVYVHGKAGDHAVLQKNHYSMMAGDLIDSLEYILK